MRQAIETRYAGPTNHRCARVIARCEARRKTVPWDYALDVPDNHRAAALELARDLEWGSDWVGGSLPDGRSYVFVQPVVETTEVRS